ncbi:glycosyltransferase [Paracoccus sp. TOH]|uniref:glycosyltransferase n=1 Tax=Paracoccus sp. TOH TaxID=1263728 RepID=UPI0025B19F51|nr:glycosyltransferase [Paracoccus sp. TOH]WJS84578.1 glycosyltransferase [Paracoccus sp. TOH]
MHPPITIALACYNGARFLRAQLDSIAAQSVTNWRLLVSDDGSTDGSRQILGEFAASRPQGQVEVIEGPRRGSTQNFLHLTARADPGGWLAYADQDDLWHPGRLALGAAFLAERKGAAIWAARTTVCDEALIPIAPAPHFPGPFGFRNALVQSALPGNTILANAEALRILQAATPAAQAADVHAHDWWAYQALSGAGAAIRRDSAQVLLYRQHPGNLMGRNDTARAKAGRASMLMDGSFAGWLRRNQRALEPVAHLFLPENRELLRRFGQMLQASGPEALVQILRMRLYRQSRSGSVALLGAALAGRLRQRRQKSA